MTDRPKPPSTVEDLARALGVQPTHLAIMLTPGRVDNHYNSFSVTKKSGGAREISAPTQPLLELQRRVARLLDGYYQPHPAAHGFVAGRGIVTSAQNHVGARFVLNVDIEDFFPSIHRGRVFGLLISSPYEFGEAAADALSTLCTLRGRLPQGAPTSPVISNMVSYRLDRNLATLAKRNNCFYTRYADDLTFSTRRASFPPTIAQKTTSGEIQVGLSLTTTVEQNGFSLQPSKTRLQSAGDRQEVTGLVVNERVNVDRRYIRRVRAILHDWEKNGLTQASERFHGQAVSESWHGRPKPLEDSLRGMIAHIAHVRGPGDALSDKLKLRLSQLTGRPEARPPAKRPRADRIAEGRGHDRSIHKLTIAHLSDFHFSSNRMLDAQPVLRQLANQLQKLESRPDAIVVTGDVAQSGTASEYDLAEEYFDSLQSAVGLPPDLFFIVAGNHDVDRSRTDNLPARLTHDKFRSIAKQEELDRQVSEFMTDTKLYATLAGEKLENYLSFHKRYSGGGVSGELWWKRTVQLKGYNVAFAGLCTALLSRDDNDRHKLALGKPIVNSVCDIPGDLRITLAHHPFDWISSADEQAKVAVHNWSDLLLTGHEHEIKRLTIDKGHSFHAEVSAPSAHQGSAYENGFVIHEIDVEAGTDTIRHHAWQPRIQAWQQQPADVVRFASD